MARLLTATVALAVVLSAQSVLLAPAAQAGVNAITLTVVSDGQAPFDTLDTGAANGTVRTSDVVTYAWNYSSDVASGGSVVFVQTLTTSALVKFDASNVTQCTGSGGGSISADGHTLTCSVLVDVTGVGSVPITVTPGSSVPHGTVISSSLTAGNGALNGGSTSTTVVGQPQLNLQANLYGTATTATMGATAGSGFVYTMVVTQPAGAKGTELVTAPLTFTTDLSAITPNAALLPGSCGTNNRPGSALPYGKIGVISGATAENSVVDSGTISCTQSGSVVTVTITGANLTGSTNPTKGAQGNQLSTSLSYLVSGIFTVFVPNTDVTTTIQRTLQYRGFDPTSATGRSNFGIGYEPGGDPAAATCAFASDNSTRTNDNCYSTQFAPRTAGWGGYFYTADVTSGGMAPGAATTATDGDGVVSPGETFFDRISVYSTSGPALAGPAVCDKWSPTDLHIIGNGRAYLTSTLLTSAQYTVQYAVLPMTTDALRRSTSCATGTWYDSIEAAGGAGVVNAVRYSYPGTVANGQYVLFYPQFEVQPNPVGTIVASFVSARLGTAETWSPSYYVRETNSPNYTGSRQTISDGRLRVSQANNVGGTQSLLAGGSVTYTVSPVVTRNTSATNSIGGVTVTDTLPSCARYEAGSASVPVEVVAGNNGADGLPCTGDAGETGTSLVFKLGSRVPGAAIAPITFKATVLRIATDSSIATNVVVISSDAAVSIDLPKRTVSGAFTVRNQTQFAVSETTTTPQLSGNDLSTLVLAYRNLSGLTVPTLKLVVELPYNGDAKGSTFSGSMAYSGITLPSNATAQCTTDPHGTISTDPASTANTYTSSCSASTTALRVTVSNLTNTSVDAITLKLQPTGNATGDKYLSSATGSYVPSGASTPVTLPTTELTQISVVSSTISGQVWSDLNNDGLRTSGEGALPSVPVALSGTNDQGAAITRSAVSAANGSYSFGGLRAGTYTVTFSGGTPPAGANFAPKKVGSDRSIDSDGNATTGVTDSLVLGAGAAITAIDQGLHLSAPTVTMTSTATTVAFSNPVTLTATVSAGATGTVTFTDGIVSGPQAGTSVTLGTGTISNGSATWTGPLPAYGANTVSAAYGGSSVHSPASSSPIVIENTAGTSDLVITQFRLSGPGGNNDQYIQLVNNGAVPVPLAGVIVTTEHGSPITLPSTAPTLPIGHSYLLAGSAYSLGTTAAADLTVASLGSTGGVKVAIPDTARTVTDAVGPAGGFATGTGLAAVSGQPTDQYAWVRLAQLGTLQDTADNAADFVLVSTTAGVVGGVQSMLGSPSPRGTGSAVARTRELKSSLLDPSIAVAVAPNRVVGPSTLTVRRVITNNTGSTIAQAKVRLISFSEDHGVLKPGIAQPARTAGLRWVNSSTSTSAITVGGQSITVQNLSVDAPAGALGGGLNSTATVPLPAGGLAPGQSVAIAFNFAVDHGGTFWFTYDVEG